MELAILVAVISAIIGPIIVARYRHYLNSKKEKVDPVVSSIKANMLVEEQLEQLKDELGACRLWISQFHNGGNFYPTGKSIQKFSVFYEITTPTTNSLKTAFQNIPVSLFSKQFAILYEKGEIVVEDMTTGPSYGLDLYQSEGPKCKSIYLLTVKGLDGRIIGVMGIHYIEKKHKLSQNEWIFIREKLGAIGNLMANYLTSKKH